MPELLAVVEAYRSRTEREQRFAAAIQGVELGPSRPDDTPSFEEIWDQAMHPGIDKDSQEEDKLAAIGIGYQLDEE